ncbi:MAG: protein kinase [Rhodobacterales bacterium]|nr:protein kinase [Rhodobacterales bacterium]
MGEDAPDEPYYGSVAAWTHAHVTEEVPPTPATERYALGGELGRGGMGVVQAANDAWLGRNVALKRPHSDLSDALRHRLMREASITAQLVHPSIVPVYDVGQDELGTYYTMPILVGESLEERLHKRLDNVNTLVRALVLIVRAVGYAHSHQIVHRDLKPANISIGEFGEVWLLDWGIAQDPASKEGEYVGTLGFQSPEQEAGRQVDGRADVFSLGQVLSEILRVESTEVPELETIARKCTQALADDRYQTAEALAGDLERWLDGRRVSAHTYTSTEVLRRFIHIYQAPIAVAMLSGLILALVVAVAFQNQREERDRAVLAEQRSELARVEADANLAVALRQQASTLATRGARSEAELLAIKSLEIAESSLARGVLMTWYGTPRTPFLAAQAKPCEQPYTGHGGDLVCTITSEVSRYDSRGRILWRTPAPVPSLGKHYVSNYRAGRVYKDGQLLIRNSQVLEVWYGEERRAVTTEHGYYRLISGPVPGVTDGTRVGRVDLSTGIITWTQYLCDRIETAYLSDDHLVAGCHDSQLILGSFEHPSPPQPIPGSPSRVLWLDGPVVGTFQGDLLTLEDDKWTTTSSTVEGVSQLLELPDDRLVVVGERGNAAIWSVRNRAFLAKLPSRVDRATFEDATLFLHGDKIRAYAIPGDLRPTEFDRRTDGGLRFLSASPSGHYLFTAGANEALLTWEVLTGQAAIFPRLEKGIGVVSGAFFDDSSVLYSYGYGGVRRASHLGKPEDTAFKHTPRIMRSVSNGVAVLSFQNSVHVIGTDVKSYVTDAPPIAITSGTPTWVSDEDGLISRIDGDQLTAGFTLPKPTGDMATSRGHIIATQGTDVVSFSTDGEELWRWVGRSRLTALHASDDWIAMGNDDGWVVVLDADGREVARAQAHERLISDVIIVGDVLFSGSWDGTARRWGLGVCDADVTVLAKQIRGAWNGVSAD